MKLSPAPVSVLIPTLNEELNILAAVDSVRWADDLWVVDSNSADRTADLAQQRGAKVVQFTYKGTGPKKKNWALDQIQFKNEWVLILDADERVSSELEREIREAIQRPDVDGFFIDRDYVFMGRTLKSFRPNWNLRLFRHKLGRYERLGTNVPFTGDNEVHEHVVLTGRAAYLRSPLLHEDKRPLRSWIDNHNRYSEWEVEVYKQLRNEPVSFSSIFKTDSFWRRRVFKRLWVRLPFRPFARFLLFYVFRRGFMDGRQGFWYSILMSYYEFLISLKLREQLSAISPSEGQWQTTTEQPVVRAPHA